MATPIEKLREYGYELPKPTAPVATYIPVTRTGNLIYVSGQISVAADGTLYVIGQVSYLGDPARFGVAAFDAAGQPAAFGDGGVKLLDFGTGGEVNLMKGIGMSQPGWYGSNAAPMIVRNVVVMGAQVQDGMDENAPSGVIRG